ncbi:ComEC/Rec2 family competence protein [Mangrovimonas spongiae]|uniref:ComEC family competence protein n=1 Tax=Mangrovimonas spongiae TaxID=2494697 RepID=A0A3R9MVS0_9FLAO|nr:ComEC/Rec2 family competence protein [Mangrovimonas spongiae]RSK41942.1 ComEC family competence protein [Mangrovimonas spongiae]
MKLLDFVIIKLLLVLILGITTGVFLSISNYVVYLSLGLSFAIFSLLYFFSKKILSTNIWFGIVTYTTTFFLGVATVNFHNEKISQNHYTHFTNTNNTKASTITFKIREVLKPGTYYDKYIVEVLSINSQSVIGKLLLNVEKDSLQNTPLNVDAVYASREPLKQVNAPRNPFQFNYKDYLEKSYIYHQLFSQKEHLLKLDTLQETSIYGIAFKIRKHINQKLKVYAFNDDVLAITNALLLGQRQNISKDIYTNYTHAGAVHILAVSGLHVGIVLLILNFLLRPLEYLKQGNFIKIIVILLCLWSFAIIAGLSASVVRAVTMFTAVAISINLKKPTNIYNILAISAFILLLVKPLFLFDVGFQLSYLAVIAIVAFQPVFYKLYTPKWALDKLLWNVITVSFAAQLGVAPIALFNFHQFPGLFFISNIVIIPFLGCILALGILIIFLALVNINIPLLPDIYSWLITNINKLVAWVSHQEEFFFDNISFDFSQVATTYLVIMALYFLITSKNKSKHVIIFLISILVLQLTFLYKKHETNTREFIVFHKSKYSIIGEKSNDLLTINHNLKLEDLKTQKLIKNYKVGTYISETRYDSISPIYQANNNLILVVDSLGVYNIKKMTPDIILLRNSPKINLTRLIDSVKPKLIIADGSNYKSYVARWKTTCKKQKLPFHYTYEKGAFIINY